MRKLLFFLPLWLGWMSAVLAQTNDIHTLTLDNGMNVVLCEDHTQAQIYGAVCVHVGSKNDPADNTGMAHYLEHLMFKGTDSIGTLDWASEKVYLDSITLLYDELHALTDAGLRNSILLHINDLSNKATQFAIPNEVDLILDKMGGKGVNAFTNYDVTVYHNRFPSNQLEQWLTVYAERFRNPIFRLFQSELEAVYEEYNMYQDQLWSTLSEDVLAAAFVTHSYGRPIIGYPQHLKNPQISAMQKFFNQYYHPANMTLVLVGDFDAASIRPLLARTMGKMRNEATGVDPQLASSSRRMNTDLNLPIDRPVGHKVVAVRETPVKMGVIGFFTVPSSHEDAIYLDLLSGLLNNDAGTGLLDRLNDENKLFMSQMFSYSMLEEGACVFLYVPRILGQSHEQAESLIFGAIDSLNQGHFSDDLFEAVKMEYLTNYLRQMETMSGRFDNVLDLVTNKQDVSYYYKKADLVRQLTKADLVAVARKYLTDDCLIFRSKMGIKSHEKIQKPTWKPVTAENTEAQSEFARRVADMPVQPIRPQQVDFKKEVSKTPVNENYALYSSRNSQNDIFTLDIVYNYGELSDKRLGTAIDYFNLQGTERCDYAPFQMELQKLGASLDVWTSEERTYVSITGFDQDLPKILALCHEKLSTPSNDEKKLSSLIDERVAMARMNRNDAGTWGNALLRYAVYGVHAYSHKMTLKELRKVSGKELLEVFSQIFQYDGYVTYVGNQPAEEVAALLRDVYGMKPDVQKGDLSISPVQTYDKPTLFLASNSHFVQSNIYFFISGEKMGDRGERMACEIFNEYMSGSMAGVIFQEIRELRSLGYSASSTYRYDPLNRRPGMLLGFLGTQSDKTSEGCAAMAELLTRFPEKPEKFENAKAAALRKKEAFYILFRQFPHQVHKWEEEGIAGNPMDDDLAAMRALTFDDVREFYRHAVGGKPLVITVVGDKRRIDLQSLERDFHVIELKYRDIIHE